MNIEVTEDGYMVPPKGYYIDYLSQMTHAAKIVSFIIFSLLMFHLFIIVGDIKPPYDQEWSMAICFLGVYKSAEGADLFFAGKMKTLSYMFSPVKKDESKNKNE